MSLTILLPGWESVQDPESVKITVQVIIWFPTEGEASGYNDPYSWGALKILCVMPIRSLILIGALLNQPNFKMRKLRLRRRNDLPTQLIGTSPRTQYRSS